MLNAFSRAANTVTVWYGLLLLMLLFAGDLPEIIAAIAGNRAAA